jgi:hypothetical protein
MGINEKPPALATPTARSAHSSGGLISFQNSEVIDPGQEDVEWRLDNSRRRYRLRDALRSDLSFARWPMRLPVDECLTIIRCRDLRKWTINDPRVCCLPRWSLPDQDAVLHAVVNAVDAARSRAPLNHSAFVALGVVVEALI